MGEINYLMKEANKALGLLLGVVIGILWLWTEPSADISRTMYDDPSSVSF